ncbi:MAG: hypothetical protein U0N66_00070 [Blautia sp.]|uniref:hypothetical protein n=1 Tax=Blautia TaxID=572511 RepID=UPI002582E70D|nr:MULTISPECIES: hypothetical protein [Blautia]
MGKSNSIQNAEKANADFRKFLLDIQENLTEKFNREEEVFEKKVQEFYTSSGYDMLMVAEGHKWSYHLMSECGVAMLKNRVKEMVEAFFGVAEGEIPEGNVEIDKTPNGKVSVPASEEVLKALNIIRFFKNLASVSAVNFIIGMFDVLSDKLEISAEHNYSSQAIAPGLTLHVDLYSAAYSNESFLKNDRIVESYVRFKLIYSYALAGTVSAMDTITTLVGKIAQMEQDLAKFDVRLFKMMQDMSVELETLTAYKMRSDMMHAYLEGAKKEKNAMIAENMVRTAQAGQERRVLRAGLRLPAERLRMMKNIQESYQ